MIIGGTFLFYGERVRADCTLQERAGGIVGTMRLERPLNQDELRAIVDLDPEAPERVATLDDGRRYAFRVSWTRGPDSLRVRGRFIPDGAAILNQPPM